MENTSFGQQVGQEMSQYAKVLPKMVAILLSLFIGTVVLVAGIGLFGVAFDYLTR